MHDTLMATYARFEVAFSHGEGCYLFATDGRRFLDFAAGVAVDAFGHCHPHLVETLRTQAGRLWHVSNLYHIPDQERLAERLTAHCFADRAFFCNSGAESIEAGIKLVRKYFDVIGQPSHYRIITFEGAFHGRTLATIAAGGSPKHLAGFDPVVDGFDQVRFNDLEAVRAAIGETTAAILVEPVQGEGGIVPVAPSCLEGLRALADEHGLLLFFDEVQCGMGRTGRLFAHEWSTIQPDIMSLAKGLGGGFPVGACLATNKVAAAFSPGSHGSTFGGNPLAMAVANAVLDLLLADGFIEHVAIRGERFGQLLKGLVTRFPGVVSAARGVGLMRGVRCVVENRLLIDRLLDHGLLAVPAADNVVRFLPPLIVTDAQIDEGIAVIERSLADLAEKAA